MRNEFNSGTGPLQLCYRIISLIGRVAVYYIFFFFFQIRVPQRVPTAERTNFSSTTNFVTGV